MEYFFDMVNIINVTIAVMSKMDVQVMNLQEAEVCLLSPFVGEFKVIFEREIVTIFLPQMKHYTFYYVRQRKTNDSVRKTIRSFNG